MSCGDRDFRGYATYFLTFGTTLGILILIKIKIKCFNYSTMNKNYNQAFK
jgi:hypothetical protein